MPFATTTFTATGMSAWEFLAVFCAVIATGAVAEWLIVRRRRK